MSFMGAIGGACFGITGAAIGWFVAGIPGEVVGIIAALPFSIAYGVWLGGRR